jgi:hypothetical protein
MTTPNGADWTTCPMCGEIDFRNYTFVYDKNLYNKYYNDDDQLLYCNHCNIVFDDWGCTHASNGCTDDVLNGHLICEWKYENETYIGMPQFENYEEYFNKIKNIEILKWGCPNNGIHCSRAFYPYDKNQRYYRKCDVVNKK